MSAEREGRRYKRTERRRAKDDGKATHPLGGHPGLRDELRSQPGSAGFRRGMDPGSLHYNCSVLFEIGGDRGGDEQIGLDRIDGNLSWMDSIARTVSKTAAAYFRTRGPCLRLFPSIPSYSCHPLLHSHEKRRETPLCTAPTRRISVACSAHSSRVLRTSIRPRRSPHPPNQPTRQTFEITRRNGISSI